MKTLSLLLKAPVALSLQVELYEQIAEAFIQLCDFQSAALHLRKAYLMSPMEEKYLVRLAFVLFLRVSETECCSPISLHPCYGISTPWLHIWGQKRIHLDSRQLRAMYVTSNSWVSFVVLWRYY